MRILGRVSTTVQCIQNGRTGSNFHIKGFVVSDLYKLLDTHCVAGNKMQQQIKILLDASKASEDDDDDEDIGEVLINERKCETVQETFREERPEMSGPQGPGTQPTSSSAQIDAILATKLPIVPRLAPRMSSDPTFSPSTPATAIPFNPGAMRTPIPPGICSIPHSSLYAIVGQDEDYDSAFNHWEQFAEEKPFKQTRKDDKPRIVNLTKGSYEGQDDMLRIGYWDQLKDPKGHQARHVLLANIRRASPDRVCGLCSYSLITNHKCSLSINNNVVKHCDDCCRNLEVNYGGGRK